MAALILARLSFGYDVLPLLLSLILGAIFPLWLLVAVAVYRALYLYRKVVAW